MRGTSELYSKKLKEMIAFAERSQKVMESSTNVCRVCVSYSRSKEDTYFENLPLNLTYLETSQHRLSQRLSSRYGEWYVMTNELCVFFSSAKIRIGSR